MCHPAPSCLGCESPLCPASPTNPPVNHLVATLVVMVSVFVIKQPLFYLVTPKTQEQWFWQLKYAQEKLWSVCMSRKNVVHTGLDTIHRFRNLLGVSEHIPLDKGEQLYQEHRKHHMTHLLWGDQIQRYKTKAALLWCWAECLTVRGLKCFPDWSLSCLLHLQTFWLVHLFTFFFFF